MFFEWLLVGAGSWVGQTPRRWGAGPARDVAAQAVPRSRQDIQLKDRLRRGGVARPVFTAAMLLDELPGDDLDSLGCDGRACAFWCPGSRPSAATVRKASRARAQHSSCYGTGTSWRFAIRECSGSGGAPTESTCRRLDCGRPGKRYCTGGANHIMTAKIFSCAAAPRRKLAQQNLNDYSRRAC